MRNRHILARMLGSQSRIVAAAVIALLVVIYADWLTGPHVSMMFFYMIVAVGFTWYLGKTAGYLVALSYAITGVFLQRAESNLFNAPLLIWNGIIHSAGVVCVVWLVNFSKNLSKEVTTLTNARTEALSRELQFRKESEEAIHRLATQLSAAEDVARRKLGQDIHDAIGQNLTVLKLQLDKMRQELLPGSSGRQDMARVLELLETVVQQSRTLTFELYPSMLDDLGLGPTLARYAEQLETHTNTRVTVSESATTPNLSPSVRAFLFRAVKELITNAIKHGKARDVIVNIREHDDGVRIFVDDDGAGFDPAAEPLQKQTGMGLAWITERMHSLGGNMRVEAERGRGVRVLLDLPLREAARQDVATAQATA